MIYSNCVAIDNQVKTITNRYNKNEQQSKCDDDDDDVNHDK